MSAAGNVPGEFEAYSEPSPFLERVGPLWQRRSSSAVVIGVHILDHHCNRRGLVHGGFFATLADVALGKAGEWLSDPPVSLISASLSIDYYGMARKGDWVEARSAPGRVGRRIAFAHCFIHSAERIIARASGVFV